NDNDPLGAAMLVWCLVLARRPLGRGALLALACATKFAPLVLVPLWGRHPFPRARGGGRRRVVAYMSGLALGTVATVWVIFLDGLDGARVFWSRTIGYPLGRASPFSIWGQHPGPRPLQVALTVPVPVAAVAALRWPRRLDLLRFAAVSGALIIGLELTLTHWFYLYVPWFLPFALLVLVPEWPRPARVVPAPAPREEPERVPVALTA